MKWSKNLLFLISVCITALQTVMSESQKRNFNVVGFASSFASFQENSQKIKKKMNSYVDKFKSLGAEFYRKIQEYKKYVVKKFKELQEKYAAREKVTKNEAGLNIGGTEILEPSYIKLKPSVNEEISSQLVTLDPQEIVSEKQKIIDKTEDIVENLLKRYPYPLIITNPNLHEVYKQETESYNNVIKFFKEQMNNGSYLKRPLENLEKNLFSLTNFGKELKKLEEKGYVFTQAKRTLDMEKILSLEVPKLEIKKPDLTQKIKIKVPEEIKYEEVFSDFPLDYENKQYNQQLQKRQNRENSYKNLLNELKTTSQYIENIDDFKEKIYKFSKLSKKINQSNNNLLLSTKPTKVLKEEVALFINQTVDAFNHIIANLEEIQKDISKKNLEKSKNIDTLFLILVTKAIEPFVNFFTITLDLRNGIKIHSPSEKLINTQTLEKFAILKNKIKKYSSNFEATQLWGYRIFAPKREHFTQQNISDIDSVIYSTAALIRQQKNRLENDN